MESFFPPARQQIVMETGDATVLQFRRVVMVRRALLLATQPHQQSISPRSPNERQPLATFLCQTHGKFMSTSREEGKTRAFVGCLDAFSKPALRDILFWSSPHPNLPGWLRRALTRQLWSNFSTCLARKIYFFHLNFWVVFFFARTSQVEAPKSLTRYLGLNEIIDLLYTGRLFACSERASIMNHVDFICLILKCCSLNKISDDNFALHYRLANYGRVKLHYAFWGSYCRH